MFCFFFFKQKTAYEMRISDWSSDVCSSDLRKAADQPAAHGGRTTVQLLGRFKPRQLLVRIFITKPVAALVACHQLSSSAAVTPITPSPLRITCPIASAKA